MLGFCSRVKEWGLHHGRRPSKEMLTPEYRMGDWKPNA